MRTICPLNSTQNETVELLRLQEEISCRSSDRSDVDAMARARSVGADPRCRVPPAIYGVAQKLAQFFVRLNFTKYYPIVKIISLPESGENM